MLGRGKAISVWLLLAAKDKYSSLIVFISSRAGAERSGNELWLTFAPI